jgi:two-component system nitrogen regulation sensor histidine kinase NtrY
LGRATKRVAGGDYTPVEVTSGSEEISSLVDSFNQMTVNLANSEREVKLANSSLRETLENLDRHNRYVEVVLGNVSAGVISVDNRGRITTINRHAGNLLKLDPNRYLGRPVRELLTLEYFRTFSELLKTMQEHKIESLQRELKVNVNGETLPLLMTLSILKDERDQEIGKILVFDDLTMILNAQRAAAWTEVARRIAHEIKNPLTPIKLSAERLQRKFGEEIKDPAFNECTTMIIRQTEDLKNLVNEFTQFARLPHARPVVGSIHQTIEEALAIFRTGHPNIELRADLDPAVPDFKFDPDQMKRVFVNLIDNAIAAVAGAPQKVVILASKYDLDLQILRLSVVDSGSGIPREQRSRVFEPYYSTKEHGTGLGLAIVKRIVEDHSGFIRALPNEPHGTKMIVELPVVEAGTWKPAERS